MQTDTGTGKTTKTRVCGMTLHTYAHAHTHTHSYPSLSLPESFTLEATNLWRLLSMPRATLSKTSWLLNWKWGFLNMSSALYSLCSRGKIERMWHLYVSIHLSGKNVAFILVCTPDYPWADNIWKCLGLDGLIKIAKHNSRNRDCTKRDLWWWLLYIIMDRFLILAVAVTIQ